MPYAKKICGVYSITSKDGAVYYGSSTNVKHRWAEHRCELKHNRHRSPKLQQKYNEDPNSLTFKIEEICSEKLLKTREQYYMDNCENLLNQSKHPTNVWSNPETREKLISTMNEPEYKQRMHIMRETLKTRWVKVECSNGKIYECMSHAAKDFGVNTSRILQLCNTQKVGNLGVRFKRFEDEWITEFPPRTRKPHSAETRALMSKNRKGWKPSEKAKAASKEASRKPVIAVCMKTGKETFYPSMVDAGKAVNPNGSKQTASSISRALAGGRPSAYGHFWRYA